MKNQYKKKHFRRLNERLSFLRYEQAHYFRCNCDGQLELPDGRQSAVTVQIYLGDAHVEGGATRISKGRRGDKDAFVDIELKMGRVLIFQQRGLFHSGEDVTKGVKYAPLHVQTFRGFVGLDSPSWLLLDDLQTFAFDFFFTSMIIIVPIHKL